MSSDERRREIVEILQTEGRVRVRALAKFFRISLVTIRQDPEFLHRESQLDRTLGGALPIKSGAIGDGTVNNAITEE
jgi:DeoR/GlpR family transcriptional regulator of sugar metabolism